MFWTCNKVLTKSSVRILALRSPEVPGLFGRLVLAFYAHLTRIAHPLDAFSAYSNETSRVLNDV